MKRSPWMLLAVATAWLSVAYAGPPYVSDDPEPTDKAHCEIYLFTQGSSARDGVGGSSGIDFNYGAGDDLQLTAVLPLEYERPRDARSATGIGGIELAAKYRFLHKENIGWDVAVFPRVLLPSVSSRVGERHSSLFVPIWVERDWDEWSTFGGGGCAINRSGQSRDFCLAGWAVTHQVTPRLRIGAELVHQGADARDARAFTRLGTGLSYDLSEHYHLLLSAGPGLEHAADSGDYAWYAALLLTY